jgi:hypothetical protein
MSVGKVQVRPSMGFFKALQNGSFLQFQISESVNGISINGFG